MSNKNWVNPFVVIKGMGEEEKEKNGPVEIEGLANRHEVDRYKEIIETDAWSKNKGLDDFYKNPIVLFNHDQDFPIGTVLQANETSEGLKVRIRISESDDPVTTRIRNLIKEGIIKSFSVGFMPVVEEKDGDIVRIKEARLHEVSAVSIPVQQSSQFAVKGPQRGGKKQMIIKALDELQQKSEEDKAAVIHTSMDSGHSHTVELDAELKNGKTTGIAEGESQPHDHEIKDGVVLAGGEDEHKHQLDLPSKSKDEEENSGEDSEPQEGAPSEFEKSLEDGEAVQSVVYSMEKFNAESAKAHAEGKGFKVDKIEEHPEFGMIAVIQKPASEFEDENFRKEDLEAGVVVVVGNVPKKSDESGKEEGQRDDETQDPNTEENSAGEGEKSVQEEGKNKSENDAQVIIDNETPTTDVGEQPHYEIAKQTNVLLGQVIGELQKLNKAIEGISVQTNAVEDQTPDAQADGALENGKSLDKLDEDEVIKLKNMNATVLKLSGYMKNLNEEMSALGV